MYKPGYDETVILRNPKAKSKATGNVKKKTNFDAYSKTKKLEQEEIPTIKKWGSSYGSKVAQCRNNFKPNKLSQSDLAKKLQVKSDVIKLIENGQGKYDPVLSSKIFRLFKVKYK